MMEKLVDVALQKADFRMRRMFNNLKKLQVLGFALSLLAFSTLLEINPTFATTVTATGTNPSICDQNVDDTTGVSSTRLSGGDCLVTFTSTSVSYIWNAPVSLYSVSYLVVGGGGGGGTGYDNAGGGGGGGGMALTGNLSIVPGANYSITVGSGGSGGPDTRTNTGGTSGNNSSFASISALGGGAGAGSRTGGAVGAAQNGSLSAPTGGTGTGGGAGGKGGGGASNAGNANSTTTGGTGGNGVSSALTGNTYSTGGAGGTSYAGSGTTAVNGTVGGANTGNGGGGGSSDSSNSASGGAGGSGVVIIRYSTTPPSINSFQLAGSSNFAIFRTNTPINVNVDVPSTVTFLANGKRISGCVSISAIGSSSSYAATCNWRPASKTSYSLTALIKPVSPGLSSTTSYIGVSVIKRSVPR